MASPTPTARRVHTGVEGVADAPDPDAALPATHEFFTSDTTAPENPDADAPAVEDEAEPPPETAAATVPPTTAAADTGAPAAPAAQEQPSQPAVTAAGAPAQPPPEAEGTKGFPWSDFREAQRERERLTTRLAEIEAAQAAAAARLAQVQQVVAPGQPAQPWTRASGRVPTPQELEQLRTEDPIEHASVVAELAQQQVAQVYQQQQLLQTQMQVRADIDSFRQQQPDYTEAAQFLEGREIARWKALGYNDSQAQQMTQARAGMVVDAAMRMGRTVPEAVYALAVADGWQTPAAPAPNGNGATAPTAPPAPTPAERVRASQARSQAANASLGNVPSGSVAPKGVIDHDTAMQLTEAEMERLDREQPGWDSQL